MRIPGRAALERLPVEIIGGRLFRFVTQEIEKQRTLFADRCHEVRYEDLCARPVETVRAIAQHCDWRWTPDFERSIPRELHESDVWRERLDPEVVEQIRAEDPPFFVRHENDSVSRLAARIARPEASLTRSGSAVGL